MSQSTQRELAVDVVRRLRASGAEALFAGGCVRDQLLGRQPKDFDVATSARPDEVRDLFGRRRTRSIGAAFGVITVRGPHGLAPIEVATFRTDGEYRDGRRPESVAFTDAEHDAQRRDFTINGLFFDPLDEQVVDYVGGQEDLRAGVIRAIGDPRRRFTEDKLRLLRAVRFATTLSFAIEPATMAAIQEMAGESTAVSGERIGAELRRIFAHSNRRRGIELLAESRLIEPQLPELATAADAGAPLWQAGLARLERLEADSFAPAVAAIVVDAVEPPALRGIAQRWRLSNKELDQIAWLVASLPVIRGATSLPWPRLQRILAHDGAADLMALAAADMPADDPNLSLCRETLAKPRNAWDPPPLATGDDLIAAGLPGGKRFAALLEFLRDEQLEGRIGAREEAITAARRWMEHR